VLPLNALTQPPVPIVNVRPRNSSAVKSRKGDRDRALKTQVRPLLVSLQRALHSDIAEL
jgi:hypothetical protein